MYKFVILGKLPTLNLPIKSHLSLRGNKLNSTLFDRYYLQNCKAITFRKIAIIPNGNKLMLQVIFIFSD